MLPCYHLTAAQTRQSPPTPSLHTWCCHVRRGRLGHVLPAGAQKSLSSFAKLATEGVTPWMVQWSIQADQQASLELGGPLLKAWKAVPGGNTNTAGSWALVRREKPAKLKKKTKGGLRTGTWIEVWLRIVARELCGYGLQQCTFVSCCHIWNKNS